MRKMRTAVFVAWLISASAAGVIVSAAPMGPPPFGFAAPKDKINDSASRILGSTEEVWKADFEKR